MRVVHAIMCPRASKRLMTSTKVDIEQTEEANVTTAAFPASELWEWGWGALEWKITKKKSHRESWNSTNHHQYQRLALQGWELRGQVLYSCHLESRVG